MQTISASKSHLWDETVSQHSGVSIFHSSAWAKVIEETYGHRSELLLCGNGCLLPITEINSLVTGKRGHCVPFADRCPILGENRTLPAEIDEIARNKKWKYLEIRGENAIPEKIPASAKFVRHSINLGSEAEKRFSQSTRRGIKKAKRSGLVAKIVPATDHSGMERYFKLHTKTRRRHGLPPQPIRFFYAIQRHIISEGLGFIAEIEERSSCGVIASAVFFEFGGTAIYKFGASDSAAWNLRPNNLLFAYSINSLGEKGQSKELDLGRSDLPDTELHRFKRGWGAEELSLSYFSYQPANKNWIEGTAPESAGDKLHNRIFRALPAAVNRFAGSSLYPHMS